MRKAVEAAGRSLGSGLVQAQGAAWFAGKLPGHPERGRPGLGCRLLLEVEKLTNKSWFELFTSAKSLKNICLDEQTGYPRCNSQTILSGLQIGFLEKLRRVV